MKQNSKQQIFLGLVLLLVVAALGGALVWFVFSLPKELAVTLTVGVLTVIATLWTTRSTKLKDRELQIQAQQAIRREEVATRFMESFWELVQNKNWSDKEKENHIKNTLKDFMVNGSLWLSDETVKTFVDYRLAAQRGASDSETIIYLARLMLAFRKDLGHTNKNLSEKDMLDVFLNDTDAIFKA